MMILQLTLTLKAPYLTQSSTPTDYGVDVSLAKNHAGQFYIPATLLIGKLRESWQELKKLQSSRFLLNIEHWLGDKSDPNKEDQTESAVTPRRKRFMIEDLVLTKAAILEKTAPPALPKHYRIRIDPQLGSVMKGAYIVTEKPFATGEEITFQGKAYILTSHQEEQHHFIFCLKKGLQWINQLGANRTIGFGELLDVQVEPIEPIPASMSTQTVLPQTTRYGLRLEPHAPFCLAERRVTAHLFRSEETISGGVIKGLLATQLAHDLPKYQDLQQYLEYLHISHAFPSTDPTTRPLHFPLSLVKVGERYYDVALCETPRLFWEGEGPTKRLSAPAFALDWKSESKIKAGFGWPAIRRESRVRTAIDSAKRRSQDNQLFAYEMVLPSSATGKLAWLASLEVSSIPEKERDNVMQQLQQLTTHPLLGLGKTKAVVEANLLALDDIKPHDRSHCTARDGVWIITLQTPALLSHPQVELAQAYRDTWRALSNNSLEMVRFFATQTLTGGRYLWKRFQDHRVDPQQPRPYRPYLLTTPGSVFVLKPLTGQEATAQKWIEQWFKTGLPLANYLITFYEISEDIKTQWQQCPYVPQNGYGEIAVNLSVHWDLCPQKENFEPAG